MEGKTTMHGLWAPADDGEHTYAWEQSWAHTWRPDDAERGPVPVDWDDLAERRWGHAAAPLTGYRWTTILESGALVTHKNRKQRQAPRPRCVRADFLAEHWPRVTGEDWHAVDPSRVVHPECGCGYRLMRDLEDLRRFWGTKGQRGHMARIRFGVPGYVGTALVRVEGSGETAGPGRDDAPGTARCETVRNLAIFLPGYMLDRDDVIERLVRKYGKHVPVFATESPVEEIDPEWWEANG